MRNTDFQLFGSLGGEKKDGVYLRLSGFLLTHQFYFSLPRARKLWHDLGELLNELDEKGGAPFNEDST